MINTKLCILYVFVIWISFHNIISKKKSKKTKNKVYISNNFSEDHLQNKTCKVDFDFYVLALQYKPGICHKNNYCKIHNEIHNNTQWTIHGLWPNKFSGIHECVNYLNNNLNTSNFPNNLTESLGINWPSLVKGNNDFKFHNHEWSKHGSCINYCFYDINDENSQHFYFNKVLELREKFDPSDIINTVDDTIDFSKLILEYEEKFNTIPHIICKRDKEINQQFLVEIRISLDLNFNPIRIEKDRNKSKCRIREKILFNL